MTAARDKTDENQAPVANNELDRSKNNKKVFKTLKLWKHNELSFEEEKILVLSQLILMVHH